MKSIEFGKYLRTIRESKNIPQRIVAHAINVDTSTLSKMELGERQVTIAMVPGLAKVLEINIKELQIKYISEKIISDFKGQQFLKEALNNTIELLNR
ncbi:MAG: helix-turn-helix transcriptional regulator [Bacteroidales bacterium]|nr:helix-turn-helix transcriptional regulator [Bacteroidales bacterium]